MNRREFMTGAFGLAGVVGAGSLLKGCAFPAPHGAFCGGTPNLRFGVLSDIHLKNPGDEKHLLNALRYFRDHGADGVLVAGDIADTGRIPQLKMLADAWYSVFPGDRRPDGGHVEKLFVYGNHCLEGWPWNKLPEADAPKDSIGYGDNRARVWEEFFHEKYEPIWMKKVRGYTFIGAHWKDGNHVDIEEFMKAHGGEIDPDRPFFYTQHAHLKDTCFGAWAWGHDDGSSTRALSKFPNAVAFSGHSHYTLTDDRSVWQGAFTSINTSSLKYSSYDYSLRDNINGANMSGYHGDEKRPRPKPWIDRHSATGDGRQGMLISVYDDRMVIERRDFYYGFSLGEDWVVPVPASETADFSYAEQRRHRVAPEFPAGAAIAVGFDEEKDRREIGRVVTLSFPRAEEQGGCHVFEYEITAILEEDDVDLVQVQRRFIAPDFHLPFERKIASCRFSIPVNQLRLKGHYRFRAVPLESFGAKGRAIWSDLVVVSGDEQS